MGRPRKALTNPPKRRPPAKTPEGRENQLIAYAMDLAEEQIINGTATSQVISHFLKLGTTREILEKDNLKKTNELLSAKTEAIKSTKNVEILYKNALDAMRLYSGSPKQLGDDEEL